MNRLITESQNALFSLSWSSVKEPSIEAFANKVVELAEALKNISEEGESLSASYHERITKIVKSSNQHIIGKLYRYTIRGEGVKMPFQADARDIIIRYLQRVPISSLGRDDTYARGLSGLMDKLGSCTAENNKINWDQVIQIVGAFDSIQKSSSTLFFE